MLSESISTLIFCGFLIPNLMWSKNTECIFFFKDFIFIYLTETASERGNISRGGGRGRSRLPAEEPDVGLDPITRGSRPEPKADA